MHAPQIQGKGSRRPPNWLETAEGKEKTHNGRPEFPAVQEGKGKNRGGVPSRSAALQTSGMKIRDDVDAPWCDFGGCRSAWTKEREPLAAGAQPLRGWPGGVGSGSARVGCRGGACKERWSWLHRCVPLRRPAGGRSSGGGAWAPAAARPP
eukprot:CAMPEP_0175418276 /NCGR_PEP_ID=MMETSP0095-20121207/45631_1 /TAXON_ID=311494 /ORGANISM="Alexandrium monilatum, Strain CCMP3105" /LENGTH=150 /DNA_ID=CAMNT_0016717433 /DNA_START=23 /DNA_END=472 /DNA_ORIENTATION=+